MIPPSNKTITKLVVNLKKGNNSNLTFEEDFDLTLIPQVIFNRIEKRITNGFEITLLMKNLNQDDCSWSINTFSPVKNQKGSYTYTSKTTSDENLINRVKNLYRIIRKIEKYNSIQIAEKYLVGYLEEKKKTLSQLLHAA